MKHTWIAISIFCMAVCSGATPSVNAMSGGKLLQYSATQHWATPKPQVVVAFGLIQHKLILEHYVEQFKEYFGPKLQQIDPKVQIKVIPSARGREVIDSLMDPNTIGLIFISHTYNAKAGSVALAADGYPLPTKVLSAATQALRFVAFFGCHGPGFLEQYQIETELKKLPGRPIFFYSGDALLNVNYLHGDTIKKLEDQMLEVLSKFTPEQLSGGVEPDPSGDGQVTLEVKDVAVAKEPRYVMVNNHIVGTLGTDLSLTDEKVDNSNSSTDYQSFTYKVPARALIPQSSAHKITVRAADTSPGFMTDNYLVRSCTLQTPQELQIHDYEPVWRLGDRDLPQLAIHPVLTGTKAAQARALNEYLHQFGATFDGPDYDGTQAQAQQEYLEFIQKQWRSTERIDRYPDAWEASTFKGRSFFDGSFKATQ